MSIFDYRNSTNSATRLYSTSPTALIPILISSKCANLTTTTGGILISLCAVLPIIINLARDFFFLFCMLLNNCFAYIFKTKVSINSSRSTLLLRLEPIEPSSTFATYVCILFV